jgi:hypothetical protein
LSVQVLRKPARDPIAPGRGLFDLGYASRVVSLVPEDRHPDEHVCIVAYRQRRVLFWLGSVA